MDNHSLFMEKCLEIAQKGFPNNSPNPMVGAIIVYNGKIIGSGYHKKYGDHHAEVNAINDVKDKSLLSQSTLYVNLEPCSHFGKTPPCVHFILENNIKNIVIGTKDPFQKPLKCQSLFFGRKYFYQFLAYLMPL